MTERLNSAQIAKYPSRYKKQNFDYTSREANQEIRKKDDEHARKIQWQRQLRKSFRMQQETGRVGKRNRKSNDEDNGE